MTPRRTGAERATTYVKACECVATASTGQTRLHSYGPGSGAWCFYPGPSCDGCGTPWLKAHMNRAWFLTEPYERRSDAHPRTRPGGGDLDGCEVVDA